MPTSSEPERFDWRFVKVQRDALLRAIKEHASHHPDDRDDTVDQKLYRAYDDVVVPPADDLCPRCDGEGLLGPSLADDVCPACGGAGQAVGVTLSEIEQVLYGVNDRAERLASEVERLRGALDEEIEWREVAIRANEGLLQGGWMNPAVLTQANEALSGRVEELRAALDPAERDDKE